ncbi:type IV secretory system conjugative DNA transfer family protein [Gemmiger formicilis]|nr:type IV secretory system conjugative DNA transfer family protein [Gemmiger formicilis]
MLENVTDRRIKGYVATTTSADIRTTLNIISSALAKLLKFVDMELEQLICSHDNALDAERFIETPTAVFLVAPDENETRHFLASLYIRFLTDDLIALAERQGGHCPRPFFFFLDEFGNFPQFPASPACFRPSAAAAGVCWWLCRVTVSSCSNTTKT